jgi:hypothetical protein
MGYSIECNKISFRYIEIRFKKPNGVIIETVSTYDDHYYTIVEFLIEEKNKINKRYFIESLVGNEKSLVIIIC